MKKERYVVKQISWQGEEITKKFQTYREALCLATNYRTVKESKIMKNDKQVNQFKF